MRTLITEKGFTLIELLIVVTIIGILLAIAMISYKSIVDDANRDVCLSNQRTVEMGRMYCYLMNSSYGNNLEELEDVFRIMGIRNEDKTSLLLCPAKGRYTFVEGTSDVVCSIEGHN